MSKYTYIIDGQIADVSKDTDFTRIYRGLETLDAKKNNYSLTIKFPFTYRNDLIFKRSNSLSYKSAFPYSTHKFDFLSNAISLIKEGTLTLISTTDSYECAITWQDVDYVGLIMNNDTKLGVFLKDFSALNWNYSWSLMDDTYTSTKADTYGYLNYNDGGGEVGISSTKYYSYRHPCINYRFLLETIFTELGITVNIPSLKSAFLFNSIIRPNKEFDRYENNVFEMYSDGTSWVYMPFFSATRFYALPEDTGSSPYTPSFGNNSYYFKTWIDSTDGEDQFFNDVSAIPQIYRFKSFANSISILEISNWVPPTSGDPVRLKRWEAATNTWSYVFTITGNMLFTLFASEGDWFAFETFLDDCKFKLTITTTLEPSYEGQPNELRFPSLFHIPTCIDLSVSEIIKQALDLTGSQLTYDVTTNTYTFADLTQQNSTAYDITKRITEIKEIKYDKKYVYSKLGQNNVWKYLNDTPINADYNVTIANDNLVPEIKFIDSPFSPSSTQSGGAYDGNCIAIEHTFPSGQIWTQYTEQPLHLLYKDNASSHFYFDTTILSMTNIFNLFYDSWFTDLQSVILSGSVRTVLLDAEMSDVEFKRINTKGLVYIETFGKFYSIIQVEKNGVDTEFFILELF